MVFSFPLPHILEKRSLKLKNVDCIFLFIRIRMFVFLRKQTACGAVVWDDSINNDLFGVAAVFVVVVEEEKGGRGDEASWCRTY